MLKIKQYYMMFVLLLTNIGKLYLTKFNQSELWVRFR